MNRTKSVGVPMSRNIKSLVKTFLKNYGGASMTDVPIAECHLDAKIVTGLFDMGITEMTTFQSDLIKMVNDGKNVLLIGSPGIGKTIAYAIAVLCHVDTEKNYPHVLCLCSSHEAAIQTGQILTQMATYTDIKIGYATRDTNVDLASKLNCHVLVGSPKEIISLKILRLFNVEQLSMCGFDDGDLIITTKLIKENIIANLKNTCRKILISSTVQNFDFRFLVPYSVHRDSSPMNVVERFAHCGTDYDKLVAILNIYDVMKRFNSQAIIFCETRESVNMLADCMELKKAPLAIIHSGLSVVERNTQMEKFHNGEHIMMVTTNILARGLRFPKVRVIINYEMPYHQTYGTVDFKRYVYRIGRSYHFGRQGLAINLVEPESENLITELLPHRMHMRQIEF